MTLIKIKNDIAKVHEDCGTWWALYKIKDLGDATDEEIKIEAMLESNMYYQYRGPGQRFYDVPHGKINKRRTKVLVTQFTGLDI